MPAAGSVRYVFPGGNTAFGFHSFYDDIIRNAFKRLFILKGGPGVGKSALIKNIGSQLLQQGYDIEYHCCSSDKNSFDGLLVPSLGIAIVDGTAPHIIDPQLPGAVDEIVNLGNFWHEKGLIELKDEIKTLTRQIKHLFARAYNYLAQAKLLNEDQESYYQASNCLNIPELNYTANRLVEKIFPKRHYRRTPKVRHLFATAITPQGLTNHLPNLFDGLAKRYIISGAPGTGKATIVHKLYETAISLGYDVEAYHCALIPTKIEHLILPELDTGVITSAGPHTYQPQPPDEVIDLDQLVDQNLLATYRDDLETANQRFEAALQKALEFLARVKEYRDKLESYYVANMDFKAINDFVIQLNDRIQELITN